MSKARSRAPSPRRTWRSTATAISSCRRPQVSAATNHCSAASTVTRGAVISSWMRTDTWSTVPDISLKASRSIPRLATRSAVATPLQFQGNFLPASATTQVNYGINLPSLPQTNAYTTTTPNSELLNPADFSVGNDPTIAGTGVVVGQDVSTFVNETIDGGSVTIYDAIGTPANLQLRWAKVDSVAAGGADTWELFYQTDATATGTNPAWINSGISFAFDANGQL